MAAKKGKGIVVLATIAVLGALTYIGFTLFGGKDDKDTDGNNTGGGGDTGGGGGYIPPAVDQPADISAFQKWVFYTKKDKSLVTSKAADGVDGLWGSKTAAAWAKYKDEYLKTLEPKPETPAGYVIPQDVKDAIATIVAMGSGNKAKKAYLENGIEKRSKRDWVRQWAAALKANKADNNKGTTFNWVSNGKDLGLYEAYTGARILDFNPAGKNPAPLSKAFWYAKPEVSNWSYVQAVGNKIGKITGYKWINPTKKLWLYVEKPHDSVVSDANIFGTRWIQADEVKF